MKSSYHVKFRRIPRKLEFHVFQGNGGSAGHLTHFEWLKRCHMSGAELVKHELKCGSWMDTWHDAINLMKTQSRWIRDKV